MPLVSVVMPVYNGEKYLAEAIESILSQTFADFELIIVDDASRDGSAEIIHAYARDDARIHFIQLADNVGEGGARNAGIAAARGDLIATMDCDDVSLPERLQLQVEFLESHPHIDMVGARLQVVDESLTPTGDLDVPERHAAIVFNLFCGVLGLSHGTALTRRELLESVSGYNAGLRVAPDFELLMRLMWSKQVRYANLPRRLYIYRRHESAIGFSYSSFNYPNAKEAKLRALEELWGEAPEETIERLMWLRPWMKLGWRERRRTRRDIHRLIDSLVAANWIDPEDRSPLLEEAGRRLEKTTPRRWQMFLHWRRYRFGR